MASEKDRLGDTLQKKERVEEERFIQEREKDILEKLRKEKQAASPDVGASLRCPRDGGALAKREELGVTLEECPTCHGIWLDRGELEVLAQRECDSWIGRLFYAPRR